MDDPVVDRGSIEENRKFNLSYSPYFRFSYFYTTIARSDSGEFSNQDCGYKNKIRRNIDNILRLSIKNNNLIFYDWQLKLTYFLKKKKE